MEVTTLLDWWDQIVSQDPAFGYYTNAAKTWLITKENHPFATVATSANTDMKVTLEGRPHLGVPVGTQGLYVMDKVQQWSGEIDTLAGFYCPNPTPTLHMLPSLTAYPQHWSHAPTN